ncbi:MAG TPA: DUF4390 domain-containing protein [Candidatus Udaeobacter sp.]|nr:DUF4390 domain-containing protein [Candidatus Udaeobacter sp.]
MALVTLAWLALPAIAHALDVDVSAPRARSGYLWVDARLSDLFPAPVESSLSRGMPATLLLHAELWRKRSIWFDRVEHTFDASVRVRYEVWNDVYRIERTGAPPRTLGSLDSVRTLLERPIALPVCGLDGVEEGVRYYVVVSATLVPLSVEDVQEVEGWLSGEVESKRHSGFGVFTELPQALYDTVRNFAGFGDRHARAQSRVFDGSDLGVGR